MLFHDNIYATQVFVRLTQKDTVDAVWQDLGGKINTNKQTTNTHKQTNKQHNAVYCYIITNPALFVWDNIRLQHRYLFK